VSFHPSRGLWLVVSMGHSAIECKRRRGRWCDRKRCEHAAFEFFDQTGIVNPPHKRKRGRGNPLPKTRAPVLDPTGFIAAAHGRPQASPRKMCNTHSVAGGRGSGDWGGAGDPDSVALVAGEDSPFKIFIKGAVSGRRSGR
jgi:hypothetical protein